MALASAAEVGKTLLDLKLITSAEWQRLWPTVVEMDGEAVLQHLATKGFLTDLQIDKLQKGDTAGYLLGPYKLQYKISAGTFARVYRSIDVTTGATVAVKVLRGRHTLDPESIRQFHREAKLTESMKHPNVVQTLKVGTDKDTNQHYIAMEFVEGGNLRELLRSRSKVAPAELTRMAIEMVEGLAYALSRGVTHRDIKPTNILFTTGGQIRWVDFGLAGVSETKTMTPLKVDEQQQRTVDYAGLEKATGAPKGDPRSDVFFLGAVLYMMLTGEPAMSETRDRNARMMRTRFDGIKPLRQNSEVPRVLADVIDKMLSFQPEQRYQNYEALLRDLRAANVILAKAATQGPNPLDKLLAGFPPGPPRLLIVHGQAKLHDDLKEKLQRRGLQAVCVADLGRGAMLQQMKPFHCVILDLATTGKDGIVQYRKMKAAAEKDDRNLAGVLLATSPEQVSQIDGLELDRTQAIFGKPVTFTQLKQAIGELLPGTISAKAKDEAAGT